MSNSEINPASKIDIMKKKKRKFRSIIDESDSNFYLGPSKTQKRALLLKHSESSVPKPLFYTSTKDYTQVIAKPSSLPIVPKIFEITKSKYEKTNSSEPFYFNLLPTDFFKANVNERFCVKNFDDEKFKKKEKKGKKLRKEKSEEETPKEYPRNKEKRENEISKNQELIKATDTESNMSEEDENVLNKIDIYKVPEKNTLVFHMYHPSKFSFQGELKITIIAGEVEVLGYTLNSLSRNDSVDIYSPNFYTPLIVETKTVKENLQKEKILFKLKDNLTESDYSTFLKNLNPNDSILLVEQIKSSFGVVINKYFDLPIFPKDFEDVFCMTDALKSLQSFFTFKFSKHKKHFMKNPEWDRIPLGQCTTLCGGKGVGKSTLLKYYINKFISLREKVLCLDFDPGQPEFSFPGCVSAVVVDQPIVGPNFTHVMDPILMVNYGDVNVSANPTKYLECVKYIIEYCQKNEDLLKMKWFVNTMGFCKGLGVSLMITILKLLKPDTVIQIKSSDFKNNYPFYLTPTTLNSQSGFRSMPLDDVILSYDLRVIYSYAEIKKKQLQGSLKQRQLRDIMSISYFSKAVSPPFYNFNAARPYLISFSELYLGIDFLIDLKDILKAFNGNTVSLSHFEPDTEEIFSVESEEGVYFKVVIKPRVSPSLGIGFVRGVDCNSKKIYLLTHLSVENLNEVNCLTLGRVCAPHAFFLKQEAVESVTAYTTSGTADFIHRVKRMFRVPGTPHPA